MYNQTSWNKMFFVIFSSFFCLFLNVKVRFFPLLVLKFHCSIYFIILNFALQRKIYLEIKNLLLRIMHFPRDIYFFKVSNGNPGTMRKMTMTATLMTAEFQLQFIYEKMFIFFFRLYMHCSLFLCSNGLNPQLLAQI